MPLLKLPFCDCYILRYPEGSCIPLHRDPLPWDWYFNMHLPSWYRPVVLRLNIVLRQALEGGEFRCEKTILQGKRFAFFRPDKYLHEVTKILRGTRYVLTFGVAL